MRRLFVAVLSLFATACVVAGRPVGPGTPPPPPPPHGSRPASAIDAGQAQRIALRIASERGYTQTTVKKVRHDEGHGGRWKVEIRGLAHGRDGKLDVRLADDGAVLEVKDRQRSGQDDDGHGKKDKKDKKDEHGDDDDD